jgi:isoleucyl-tRNA synthetase
MFKSVSSKVNFPKVEEHILHLWRERNIFERSIQLRRDAPQFTLYEGPPTVNGNPGIHHVLSRVFKDVIPRYKTMKGFCAPRKAGWDTHGLPVELEVEKELGFTNKAQIEQFGVAQFNARCRESVLGYLKEWENLTERIGFWLDMKHPYVTFDNSYIESCWWVLKQLWDKGLVYQGYRVTPHCPRCGTSLSSHEVALGYRDDAEDPSVYVKFEVPRTSVQGYLQRFGARPDLPTYLLAWTTTPWTLPGNTALAVAPDADYAIAEVDTEGHKEQFILAEALLKNSLTDPYRILGTCKGEELVGVPPQPVQSVLYKPLFHLPDELYRRWSFVHGLGVAVGPGGLVQQSPHKEENFWLIAEDFVSLDEGTGIVHIAPAFGEVDYEAGGRRGLYFVRDYVDLQGNMRGDPLFEGKFVKEADPLILQDLKLRRLLYRSETIRHTYPFCWRCEAPLLYYAKPTWYIKTTSMKDSLIKGNEEINWYPEHIKYGRFGDWLENNVDWAFSRERYWGTPLPIWHCEQCPEQVECIGSVGELKNKPGLEGLEEPLDLHRPFVDQVTYQCPKCGGRMRRVPEVLDCWFDSGAMPVAQWHYPFENQEQFNKSFPADYISEAVDQTRGWFYTLHALSTLLFQRPCFRNVICLGHIVDAEGEKMSKAKGNVVDPWTIISKQGADALRWYMLTSSPPGNVKRFSADQVTEVMRRFLSTLWNTYSFFVIYANIDHFDPSKVEVPQYSSDLDRWIISELNQLILQVSKALDNYDPTEAGRRIEQFVDQLSNWYVRRSRRRFWKSESDADKLAAYFALYQCLVTLSKLLAPFTPFIAEELYQNLVRSVYPEAEESVHLCDFPVADLAKVDDRVAADAQLAIKVCSLGRAARSKAGIKVRQPLAKVVIKTRSRGDRDGLERLASQILEELNVKGMEFAEPEVDLTAKPGYSLAAEGGYEVAVTTDIPPELREEGIAREIVHRLQTMRRNAGFDIADYIITYYQTETPLQQVMENFASYIKQETLSEQLLYQVPKEGSYTEDHRLHGCNITLGVKRTRVA